MILPDADSSIARVHAMVRLGSEEAYLANLCERRPIEVDREMVQPGQEIPLPMGAHISIGPYLIGVYSENSAPPSPSTERAFAPAPSYSPPAVHSPAPLSEAPLRPAPDRALVIPDDFNPFEVVNRPIPKDEWGGLQEQSLTELAQQSHDGLIKTLPLSGTMDDQLDNPAHSGLPKQLDPSPQLDPLALFSQSSILVESELTEIQSGRTSELSHVFHLPKANNGAASILELSPNSPSMPPAAGALVSEDSLKAVQSAGLQSMQGLDLSLFGHEKTALSGLEKLQELPNRLPEIAPIAARSVPAPLQGFASDSIGAADSSEGGHLQAFGLTLFGDQPAARTVAESSIPSQPPSPAPSHSRSPITASPPAQERPPSPAPVPQPKIVGRDALHHLASAFLEGAGLSEDRVNLQLTPEFMRAFGEAFRIAIEGSIDLLAARSEVKQEFRAGVTIIASSANNPLKFLPNADGVIMQLVGQNFPGFMKPAPAIKEAYDDLRVHQLALMAGIRAAYTEALKRFDPQTMEQKTPKTGVLSAVYDGAHKAALWDEYKRNFSKIKDSAEDDLTAFSGQTFVQAYEAAAAAAKGQK